MADDTNARHSRVGDPLYSLEQAAAAFGMDPDVLADCQAQIDTLLTANDASTLLGLARREFDFLRKILKLPVANATWANGKSIRFSRRAIEAINLPIEKEAA